jgi:hypothetical protein
MRALALLLLALVAGCFNIPSYPPCNGTVRVQIDYDSVTSQADSLVITLFVYPSEQHNYALDRKPGALNDTLDVHFSDSTWLETLTMIVKAYQGQTFVGSGHTKVAGGETCKGADVAVGPFPPPDFGM